jgi:GNAT superfamily N-acetyltransferase
MSKFVLTASYTSLAAQIATLVNAGGQLRRNISVASVLYGPTQYLIELDHERVIGTMGLHKHNQKVTELKYLCVHPAYRRQGLGRKLLEKGIAVASTEFVYGAVRSDNATNIRNNFRVGMKLIGKKRRTGYYILIFARRKGSDNRIHQGRIEG